MANFESLTQSKKEINRKFFEFYGYVIKMQTSLLDALIKNKKIDDNFKKEIYELENKCNMSEVLILDECSWTISKEHPVAEHLRMFVATLNSIKDLERMGDYMKSTCDYFYYHPTLEPEFKKIIIECLKNSVEINKKIYQILKSKKENTFFSNVVKLDAKHQKKYHDMMVIFAKTLVNSNVKEKYNLFSGSIVTLKNIERNASHALNILENFVYVKNSNYFIEKRTASLRKKGKKKCQK